MKETVRLFDRDAYARSFRSKVVSCQAEEEGRFLIVLEETLFFPEAGGQSSDRGKLDEALVLDVQIDGGKIIHYTDKPLKEGRIVSGEIDWQHRFSHMQQHTAEHIFSGIVKRLYGWNNVGFHLSEKTVTMDYDGVLSMEQLEEVEWEVNQVVVQNLEVEVSYPSKEELEKIPYRSKIEIEGDIRIVTIEGYDRCACCAPHVRRTGEIGAVKVMALQNHKGGVRVNILCGFRALQAFREKMKVVSALTNLLSTNQEALPRKIEGQMNQISLLKGELAEAKKKLMEYRIKELDPDQTDVLLFERELDMHAARSGVNLLMQRYRGICGIFVEKEGGGYQYILGSKEADCRETARMLREKLDAKGGGSKEMIQGFADASKEDLEELLCVDRVMI